MTDRPTAAGPGGLRSLTRELWSGGRGPILVAVATGWLLAIGVRLVFPALLPRIRAEFGFDLTTAGLLLTALWIGYAVMQFPGGLLGDRVGERAVLVLSTAGAAASLVVIVLSAGPWWFYAGTVLFGLGTGLYATTRFTVLSDVYPERDGTAIGLSAAAGNLGTAVLPVAAGVVAGAFGWRWGFGAAVPVLAVTAVGLAVVVPRRTSGAPTTGADRGLLTTARRVLAAVRGPRALLTGASMLLMSFIYQSFTSFYPTYLVSVKGIGDGAAAGLFGLFFAAGIVVQPLAGVTSDRFGPQRTTVLLVGLTVVTLVALPATGGFGPLAAVTVLASAQLGFWPVAQSYLIDALPGDVQGSGFGLIRSAYLVLAASGPTAVGTLADAGYFDEAFLLLALAAALAGLPALVLPAPAGG